MKNLSYVETEIYRLQRSWMNQYLGISTISHICLLLLIMGANYIFNNETENILPSIQVDLVDLPRLKKNEIPIEDLRKKAIEKKVNKIKREKTKDRIRSLKKIKKLIKERDTSKRTSQEKNLKKFEDKYRVLLAGNQKNTGDSITGALKTSINSYVSNIINQIREHWELPLYLQDKGLRASVTLFIDAQGNARYTFQKRSGNNIFDELVRNALELSIPFSPPPIEIVSLLRRNGIEVLFPL